ncbi:hypothetical protein [Achromobacter xylosoxidans]|nr:hypothetical protein [Achromobacter xylosoxidans]
MMTRFFGSRFYSGFLLLFFFLMVAAASFNGFYTKWRLNDGHPSLGLSYMVEGTAARPYVYRQLLPAIANQVQAWLPPASVERISKSLSDPRKVNSRSSLAMKYPESEALKPAVALRYYIVYYLTFFALVACLYVMRALCLRVGATAPAAIAAPAVMALLLPFMLTEGGYFYDFTEALFIMSAVTLALGMTTLRSWRVPLLLALAGLATWNKEAFFWFTPALYPLLRGHLDRVRAAGLVSALMLVGGCVYLAMRLRYAGNPGTTVDFQLWDNLLFYADPGNWFRTENTYGILLPRGFSIVFMLVFAGLLAKAWRSLPAALRNHGATAAAINLPLFFLFCSPGEMRNLSMLYPTLLLLIACALSAWLAGAGHANRSR